VSEQTGQPPVLRFRGDSDALIVRGLIGIVIAMFSAKTPREILAVDAERVFDELGLKEHLTPQRTNGLTSMVARIRFDAEAALK
jgi:cysteine desulfuration protein SufE